MRQFCIVYTLHSTYDYFSGRPEELKPAAPADEEKPLLTVTSGTRLHTNLGEAITIQYFVLDNSNYFLGHAGSGHTRPFKPKLSKASQEAVYRRNLLLENEKKKDNT